MRLLVLMCFIWYKVFWPAAPHCREFHLTVAFITRQEFIFWPVWIASHSLHVCVCACVFLLPNRMVWEGVSRWTNGKCEVETAQRYHFNGPVDRNAQRASVSSMVLQSLHKSIVTSPSISHLCLVFPGVYCVIKANVLIKQRMEVNNWLVCQWKLMKTFALTHPVQVLRSFIS